MSNSTTIDKILSFHDFVGQPTLKKRLKVSILSAQRRGERLDHVLLASNMPGVGKTSLAHIIAAEMGVNIVEVTAPIKAEEVANLSDRLNDHDILFIDEAHKLADGKKANAEFLLKLLEKGTIPMGDDEIVMPNITIILATTDSDKLPEPILDRLPIKPVFERYALDDMIAITHRFASRYDVVLENPDLVAAIAGAARFTPRVISSFIAAARDLREVSDDGETEPTVADLLDFEDVTADGLTKQHRDYLKCLWEQKRTNGKGEVVCEAGGALLKNATHMSWGEMERMERYIVEIGLVQRTTGGRLLTAAGIKRTKELIAAGK